MKAKEKNHQIRKFYTEHNNRPSKIKANVTELYSVLTIILNITVYLQCTSERHRHCMSMIIYLYTVSFI